MNAPVSDDAGFKPLRDLFYPYFWGAADMEKVAALAQSIKDQVTPGFFFADNLLTWGRNLSMMEDRPFVEAWLKNFTSHSDFAIVWRRYILACAAQHAVNLDGDFVECGCYKGTGIKTIVDYLGGVAFPRTFWGYDMFEHTDGAENHALQAHGPQLVHDVRARFADYPQVKIVQGKIPAVLAGQSPERISLLHIDLNQATGEIAALDALFDRVVPAGMVVLDDYEWGGHYRQQHVTEKEWFLARGYRVMPLPTGQGLVIKR